MEQTKLGEGLESLSDFNEKILKDGQLQDVADKLTKIVSSVEINSSIKDEAWHMLKPILRKIIENNQ